MMRTRAFPANASAAVVTQTTLIWGGIPSVSARVYELGQLWPGASIVKLRTD